jgi:hypothetical protein
MQGLCLFALNELDEAAKVMRRAIAMKDGNHLEGEASDLLGLGDVLLKKETQKERWHCLKKLPCMLKGLGLVQEMEAAERAKKALGFQ